MLIFIYIFLFYIQAKKLIQKRHKNYKVPKSLVLKGQCDVAKKET